MTSNTQGVYAGERMQGESRRLETFAIPDRVSLSHTRRIGEGAIFLDIGAGERAELRQFVQSRGAKYAAIDRRSETVAEHRRNGASGFTADLLTLPNTPIGQKFADYVHARFVIGHFPDRAERAQVVRNTLGLVRPGGRGIYSDYDWNAMDGTEAVQELRDFTLGNVALFDAGYGAKSGEDIREIVGHDASLRTHRYRPEPQSDYYPLTSIREVTVRALQAQQANSALVEQAHDIFDRIDTEATSPNAPGFRMPDIVTVSATPSSAYRP